MRIGRLQRCLDLVRFGRTGAVDRIGKHEEALHPARAGVIEIAAIFGFEHLIDDVAVAAGLTDIKGAAVDGALSEIADVWNKSWIGKAGIVADDDRWQIVEILHGPEIQNRVGGIADEDDGVGLQGFELDNLRRICAATLMAAALAASRMLAATEVP